MADGLSLSSFPPIFVFFLFFIERALPFSYNTFKNRKAGITILEQIKNLIFDVGHVLIGYGRVKLFTDHNIPLKDAARITREVYQEEDLWADGIDRGTLTIPEALEEYQKRFPDDIELIEWFITNTYKMVIPHPEIWDKIARLKSQRYSVYLLSNYAKELFRKHTEGLPFLELIDGGVISYQVKVSKPDARIYQILMEKYHLLPEECLFFDDKKENVTAAMNLGIHARQVTSRIMLNETLEAMIS